MSRDWGLSITLPTPSAAPYTLAQNVTPGWESPWSPRNAAQGPVHSHTRESSYDIDELENDSNASHKSANVWRKRKKKLRAFILTNPYVPLVSSSFSIWFEILMFLQLFRFINITFTTAALAIAIHIRKIEITGHALGAVGSSPYVPQLNTLPI